ncbi:hypothetical protein MKW92_021280 [Papaver armeniacum]|nr:hypothetical protein MKW92_021280 [Papaver armeniacum]
MHLYLLVFVYLKVHMNSLLEASNEACDYTMQEHPSTWGPVLNKTSVVVKQCTGEAELAVGAFSSIFLVLVHGDLKQVEKVTRRSLVCEAASSKKAELAAKIAHHAGIKALVLKPEALRLDVSASGFMMAPGIALALGNEHLLTTETKGTDWIP